ncbi:hypothetical protein [Flavobacterium sp. N1994]|uniref:hypothetical protein n=1 Tax=Flavobacterium sp. N1994 TaxID=2986827 RepID=UPI0022239691|nr:hypothetical protein [Flavobacterium sp. N1994]
MHFIQLNKIYMELARRYKCHRFEVFSNMNRTGTSPVETMIEFWLPRDTKVDQKKLGSTLEKYISNVKFFHFIIEDDSIFLIIKFHQKKNMLGMDYEFSLN